MLSHYGCQIFIGMDKKDVNGNVTLTQWRQNISKWVDTKAGRKKPRLNDYDVIPVYYD